MSLKTLLGKCSIYNMLLSVLNSPGGICRRQFISVDMIPSHKTEYLVEVLQTVFNGD